MDRYLLSNVPRIANVRKSTAKNVEKRFDEAIERMKIVVSDSYTSVFIFSIYWKSDDTGGQADSSLFIDTLSKLQNVESFQRSLDDIVMPTTMITLASEMARVASQSGRRLLILHYAGHAIASSTSKTLIITPKIGQELGCGPQMNMSLMKDLLKDLASTSLGLDVLLVMDSCCAGIAGRGREAKSTRVELVAATARKGVSNSRQDGQTFTQHWCEAFTRLLKIGKPFTCDDIIKCITPDPELEQFPATFVLREGCDLPITFHAHPSPITSTLPLAVTSPTVVTAFHIEEDPESASLKNLIKYLDEAPVKITVLVVLPTPSTLLLLRVPVFLQDLLILPRVALFIDS